MTHSEHIPSLPPALRAPSGSSEREGVEIVRRLRVNGHGHTPRNVADAPHAFAVLTRQRRRPEPLLHMREGSYDASYRDCRCHESPATRSRVNTRSRWLVRVPQVEKQKREAQSPYGDNAGARRITLAGPPRHPQSARRRPVVDRGTPRRASGCGAQPPPAPGGAHVIPLREDRTGPRWVLLSRTTAR